MRNACSDLLKDYMQATNIRYHLVPPDTHRRNAAERAIRTFKNHFIAGLCTTDPSNIPHSPVGPIAATGNCNPEPATGIQTQPQPLSIRPHLGCIRF